MLRTKKLPFQFDVERLEADLAGIAPEEWVPHFNQGYYDGDWSAVPLRSIGGEALRIFPDPVRRDYADTPILRRCGYFQEVLRTFECPMQSARLLRLGAGSVVKAHSDFGLTYENGDFRIHVPIVTNPELDFFLEEERLDLKPGECWYINFNLLHSLNNRGASPRVHLVFDCDVNEWVRDVFERRPAA
jgi:hypothetical protein